MQRKLLLALGFLMLSGGAFELGAAIKKMDCIPCSAWCKKHPNADRCN